MELLVYFLTDHCVVQQEYFVCQYQTMYEMYGESFVYYSGMRENK